MPTATVTVTALTTHQLALSPQIKRKLLLALRTYTELSAQAKALQLAKHKQSKIVEDIQTELGESHIEIEGFKATVVAPIRHTLDKKRFVALGGDLDILERAMVDQSGKAYVKITAPNIADDNDDES